jgi:hypothetical protein
MARIPRPAIRLWSDHVHICMCWAGKRVKSRVVRTQLTGAVHRLIVKFIIFFLSLLSAVKMCVQYAVRCLTSGEKLLTRLRQNRIKKAINLI